MTAATIACVFVGPTLPRAEARAAFPEAAVLPPAAQGDVFRAVQAKRPRAIGIIDGYFEGVPSVWHKEILWAMSRGVHAFGAASMGALRAAELSAFGMRGVGPIFEAYRGGELEDDDEVAILHGPAEVGFLPLSEAMVNIRATLERAEHEGVVAPATRAALVALGKGLFYRERTWDALLQGGAGQGLPEAELVALRDWLPQGRVDRKGGDALAMLTAMRGLLTAELPPEPMRAAYHFEWTEAWETATALSAAAAADPKPDPGDDDADGDLPLERLLDELRLEGDDACRRARRSALLRLLALREADRRRLPIGRESVVEAVSRFRTERGLFSRAGLDRWLARNGLDAAGFERLMAEEARLAAVESVAGPALRPLLLDELRASGDYTRLADRARDKRRVLAPLGLEDPEIGGDAGPAPAGLVVWYFERRLGRPVPDDPDAYARGLGFASRADFHRAIASEYLYWRATMGQGAVT